MAPISSAIIQTRLDNLLNTSSRVIGTYTPIQRTIRAHEAESRHIFSSTHLISELSTLTEGMNSEEATASIRATLLDLQQAFTPRLDGLHNIVDQVLSNNPASKEKLISAIAETSSAFISERFTLKELEEIERKDTLSNSCNHAINNLIYLTYHFDNLSHRQNSTADINLHRAVAFSNAKKLTLLREGLKLVALKLLQDPGFANVSIISARSWIIEKRPKLIEKLGFTLTDLDSASVNREDFLNRYLKA